MASEKHESSKVRRERPPDFNADRSLYKGRPGGRPFSVWPLKFLRPQIENRPGLSISRLKDRDCGDFDEEELS